MPIALAPFDPSRDFVAKTFFRAGGFVWTRKRPFDKSCVNDRVLRQLYDARKIGYAEDTPAEPELVPVEQQGDQTPEEKHEAEIAAEQQDNEGASGTAREAPGAEESAPATSGEASAPASEGEAASPETAASPPTTEAAAEGVSAPAEGEAAAAPAGEAETAAADRDHEIDHLMVHNSHAALLEKAKGLPGANSKTPKKKLAELILDAGRA